MVKTSASNAGGAGLIPGRGANIPHALGQKTKNIKQKQYCNKINKDFKKNIKQKLYCIKFNKDFKNGPHQKKSLKNIIKST